MNEVCCQKNCEKPAEWEIYADTVPDTVACTDHVGELLTDAQEHRIFRFGGEKLTSAQIENKAHQLLK